ncbi:MAG: phosphonate metabolism transcriptional regulator PhnF [Panacagrimonas sp.]
MNTHSSEALWRRIATSVEDKIRAQEYLPGDRLPPEREMSQTFMVNRHTVRRALVYLQQKRLVESTQGRGSYIRRPAILYQIGKRTRFGDSLRDQDARPRTETKSIRVQRATERTARALSIGLGKPVIAIERVGYANDLPISTSRHYFSHERLPNFVRLYNQHQSITITLQHCGIADYTRLRTVVTSRLPTVAESELLHVPRHVPMIVTRSWNVDDLGAPLEYGEACIASDRMELEFEGGG